MHVPRTCHARAHAHAGHLHSMHTHMGTRHAHAHAHAMRMPCTRHAHAHAPRRRGPRRTSRCGPRPGRGARSGGPRGPPLATRPSRYGLAPPSPPCHAGATPRTARSRRRSSCPAIDRSRDRQLGITRCTARALHGSAMLGPSQPRHQCTVYTDVVSLSAVLREKLKIPRSRQLHSDGRLARSRRTAEEDQRPGSCAGRRGDNHSCASAAPTERVALLVRRFSPPITLQGQRDGGKKAAKGTERVRCLVSRQHRVPRRRSVPNPIKPFKH